MKLLAVQVVCTYGLFGTVFVILRLMLAHTNRWLLRLVLVFYTSGLLIVSQRVVSRHDKRKHNMTVLITSTRYL